ncbi:hypothetical protein MHU86_12253 [Fragilaria crotonensis]|nr:hypothetical protein MHU86_12253 [Fragilaria crotonensis]
MSAPSTLLFLGGLSIILCCNLSYLTLHFRALVVDTIANHDGNSVVSRSKAVIDSWENLSMLLLPNEYTFNAFQNAFRPKVALHEKYIEYQRVRGPHYNRSQISAYACRNITTWEPLDDRAELPSSSPFDFYTYIQTNLNILVMGDSLAVEFGSWFQNAGRGTDKNILKYIPIGDHLGEGLTTSKVDGGGSISYWRILGLWEKRTLNRPLPNLGKGWNESWPSTLRAALPDPSDKINVLIFRVSHPWLGTREVTVHRLMETVALAKLYLGEPLPIIFVTVPLNNNVVTKENMADFRAMNDLVRTFVRDLNASDVLLSDVEAYLDNVIEWNANMIGMDTSDPSYFLAERLRIPDLKYRHHVAAVCSERNSSNMTDCQRNMLVKDGLHFCMETLGPRLYANWACLIQCSFGKSEDLRQCELECNKKNFYFDEPMTDVKL